MKFTRLFQMVIFLWIYASSFNVFSQQTEVLKEIPLSSSESIIVQHTVEPLESSEITTAPFKPITETFQVILKNGTTETELDRSEFKSISLLPDSSTPRFSIYDASLEGNYLHYIFINKGRILLATAQVDESGAVSNYRQKSLPETVTRIDTARFEKNKNGRMTLKIREPGKKTKAFQFDNTGEAFPVPAEQVSSSSSQ